MKNIFVQFCRRQFVCLAEQIAPLLLVALPLVGAGCSEDPLANVPALGPLGGRQDLPVDERVVIDGLSAPVDVVRDTYGRPHIYASTLTDAMRAEGYFVARDRTVQLDLLRRTATGRLAETFGQFSPDLLDQDILFRHVGLRRIAVTQWDTIKDPEIRSALEAYSGGITQAFSEIRTGKRALPDGIAAYPIGSFEDWTPVDSLAVARLQTYFFSYEADAEIDRQALVDSFKELFSPLADPVLARRTGIERDLFRMSPLTSTNTSSIMSTFHADVPASSSAISPHRLERFAASSPYRQAMQRVRDNFGAEGFGSNAWAINASKSSTGHAILANDPHLGLGSPSFFWPVSLHVGPEKAGLHVAGVALPGVPGVIIGHNDRIAWGSTVAPYDVVDVYEEELTPDGGAVMFQGKAVAFETIQEVIATGTGSTYTYDVRVVPHHGPIVPTIVGHAVMPPDPAVGALSVRWTGFEPTHELEAIFSLMRATGVDEARTALKGFDVGAQGWVVADTAGDILWTTHARLPVRDTGAMSWDPSKYTGNLPCLVLPGDGSAEWKGVVDDDSVPWEKNPPSGFLVAANNDPVGTTKDGNPVNDVLPDGSPLYLSCEFDFGVRAKRIVERLEAPVERSPGAMASIQADVRSELGAKLVPVLFEAMDRAEAERATPGTYPDIAGVVGDVGYVPSRIAELRSLLEAWGAETDYEAASGLDPATGKPLAEDGDPAEAKQARAARATLVFNTWLVRFLRRTFGDEYTQMGRASLSRNLQLKGIIHLLDANAADLATFDPMTGESAIWDDLNTPEVESRHERMLRALLDAIPWLDASATGPKAYWGAHHRVRFTPDIPLFSTMAIPPSGDPVSPGGFARHGDTLAVDACDFRLSTPIEAPPNFAFPNGAAQRFIVDLDPAGVKAWNAIPGGNIWDSASPHFLDEAEFWRKNENHIVPFAIDDVVAAKESRAVLASP